VKKKPKYNQNSVIRGALRRAFARSPLVQDIMQASRREVPRYKADGTRHKKNWVQRQCQVCDQWASASKMAVDHIDPVVSIDDGFQDWNEFIDRLWCNEMGPVNLQRICDMCHDKKTAEERIARLIKKYTLELNALQDIATCDWDTHRIDSKALLNAIKKYIAKKKTKGLEQIVERAQKLKIYLEQKEIKCQVKQQKRS
jgi:hypothetical protein